MFVPKKGIVIRYKGSEGSEGFFRQSCRVLYARFPHFPHFPHMQDDSNIGFLTRDTLQQNRPYKKTTITLQLFSSQQAPKNVWLLRFFWFHQLRPAQQSLSRPKADHKPTKNHPKNVLFLRFSISKELVYYTPPKNSTVKQTFFSIYTAFWNILAGLKPCKDWCGCCSL